jgi:hypothetical protein
MIRNLCWAAGYSVLAVPAAAGVDAPWGVVLSQVKTSFHACFTASCGVPASCGYLESMRRRSGAVLAMLVLAGLMATVSPLRADETHCAEPIPTVTEPMHRHGVAPRDEAGHTVLPGHGCPSCPAKSCRTMQGCSATPQLSPEFVQLRVAPLPACSTVLTDADVIPTSVIHAPPTPPPLVALSPA